MIMPGLQVSHNCSCKVRKCELCLQCSRCGCDHDGQVVALKKSRKRGRYPGSSTVEDNGTERKSQSLAEADGMSSYPLHKMCAPIIVFELLL